MGHVKHFKLRLGTFGGTVLLALFLVAALLVATAQKAADPVLAVPSAPLPLEQVLKNLEERNAQRSVALKQFEGKRVYRMQYHGFPSERDAEMVVKVKYHAPNTKEFSVVSQTGSKFVIDHVFKKLLEGEQDAGKGDNRHQTALTRDNYNFALAGYEATPDGDRYILALLPKTNNKFLYRGKIWVDAKDFAVTRIEGEPGRNPSFWIKKTEVSHKYVKVSDFWLPAENRTESIIRLGGKAILSIEYQDYKIIQAAPLDAAETPRTVSNPSLAAVN